MNRYGYSASREYVNENNRYAKETFRSYDSEPRPTSDLNFSSNVKNFSAKPQPVNTQTSGYKSGKKVQHAKFGVGTVIMVKGEGKNLVVDVAFPGVGIKSLAVAYAPLKLID